MCITPLPRFQKINWLNKHNKLCNDIMVSNYSTLLIGDSLIAGLSRYSDIWKRYFESCNSINCGIGGDRVENVLWRCNNLPPSHSFKTAVILCGTNNIQCDSTEDITDGIIEITQILRKKYRFINVIVCGLLPRDHNCSVNRVYIKEINADLQYKCKLNNANFINPSGWTLENDDLNQIYFILTNFTS